MWKGRVQWWLWNRVSIFFVLSFNEGVSCAKCLFAVPSSKTNLSLAVWQGSVSLLCQVQGNTLAVFKGSVYLLCQVQGDLSLAVLQGSVDFAVRYGVWKGRVQVGKGVGGGCGIMYPFCCSFL